MRLKMQKVGVTRMDISIISFCIKRCTRAGRLSQQCGCDDDRATVVAQDLCIVHSGPMPCEGDRQRGPILPQIKTD